MVTVMNEQKMSSCVEKPDSQSAHGGAVVQEVRSRDWT